MWLWEGSMKILHGNTSSNVTCKISQTDPIFTYMLQSNTTLPKIKTRKKKSTWNYDILYLTQEAQNLISTSRGPTQIYVQY